MSSRVVEEPTKDNGEFSDVAPLTILRTLPHSALNSRLSHTPPCLIWIRIASGRIPGDSIKLRQEDVLVARSLPEGNGPGTGFDPELGLGFVRAFFTHHPLSNENIKQPRLPLGYQD